MTEKATETQRGILLYHRVLTDEGFDKSASDLFELIRYAQQQWPGKRRILSLDVDGHRNSVGGFTAEMFELMNEYVIGHLGRYLSEVITPLTHVANPNTQDDDVPDLQQIAPLK